MTAETTPSAGPTRSAWVGGLVVIAGASLFGSLGVLSRFAYAEGMTPFSFMAWRATIAALGLWLIVLVWRRPAWVREQLARIDRRSARWLAFGVACSAGLNLASFLAFDNTTVALALLGFYTYPAMVAAGSVALGRERLDLARAAALVLALGGMAAVVLGGEPADAPSRSTVFGIALALGAALCQTGFVLTSRIYARVPTDLAMGSILIGCAVAGVATSLLAGGSASIAFPLERPALLGMLLYVGIFGAALPSVLFLTGIRWLGAVRAGILMLFEPVVGVVLAALLLAEGLQPLQLAGGATILAAAYLVQRSATHEHAPTEADDVAIAPAPGGP